MTLSRSGMRPCYAAYVMTYLHAPEGSTAPPILLLHGGSLNARMWDPVVARMPEDVPLLSLDLLGHGANVAIPFTLDGAADAAAEAIWEAFGRPALVAGLSLGGYVAMRLAERQPDCVRGLVLSGCTVSYFGWIGLAARANAWISRRLPNLAALERKRAAQLIEEYGETGEEMANAGLSALGGAAGMEGVLGRHFSDFLPDEDTPIWVVNGDGDRLNAGAEDTFIRRAGREIHVERISGAGHLCSLDEPEAYAAALLRAHRLSSA